MSDIKLDQCNYEVLNQEESGGESLDVTKEKVETKRDDDKFLLCFCDTLKKYECDMCQEWVCSNHTHSKYINNESRSPSFLLCKKCASKENDEFDTLLCCIMCSSDDLVITRRKNDRIESVCYECGHTFSLIK